MNKVKKIISLVIVLVIAMTMTVSTPFSAGAQNVIPSAQDASISMTDEDGEEEQEEEENLMADDWVNAQEEAPENPEGSIVITGFDTCYAGPEAVAKGTDWEEILSLLPEEISVTLEDGTETSLPVTWTSSQMETYEENPQDMNYLLFTAEAPDGYVFNRLDLELKRPTVLLRVVDPYGISLLADNSGYLSKGGSIPYAGWSTHRYTFDGKEAYCANPSASSPGSGTYTKTEITDTEIAAVLYFGYGGPGFNPGMWPDKWYDGSEMSADKYRILTHIVLSDIYSQDSTYSYGQCSSSFISWCEKNVIGYSHTGAGLINRYTPRVRIAEYGFAATGGSSSWPTGFKAYAIYTGSGSQLMMSFTYDGTDFPAYSRTWYQARDGFTPSLDIHIEKSDADTGEMLEGAEFTVYMDDTEMGTVTTDGDGKTAYHWRGDSLYTAYQSSSYKYYCANYDSLNAANKQAVNNSSYYNTMESAYTAAKSEALGKISTALETLKTDTKHTWKVVETKAPDGYSLNEEIFEETLDATVTAIEVDFTDIPEERNASAYIKKTDSQTGEVVPGAVYYIYTDKNCTNIAKDVYGSYAILNTTDSEPWSNVVELEEGTYYVKEHSVPDGYLLDKTVYTAELTAGETVYINGTNVSDTPYGTGEVKKVSTTDSSIMVAGAEYTAYTDRVCKTIAKDVDGKNAVLTTTSSGSNTLKLLPGTYYLKETKSPEHYTQNPEVKSFTIKKGALTTVQVKDAPKGKLSLQKKSANENLTSGNPCYSLKGAVYGVYKKVSDAAGDENRIATLITLTDGSTKEVELDAGSYFVKEITASQGYLICDGSDGSDRGIHTVTVKAGQRANVECVEPPVNDPLELTLRKLDTETGESAQGTASFEGAIFALEYYTNTVGNTSAEPFKTWYFKTDEDGRLSCQLETDIVNTTLNNGTELISDELFKDAANGDIIYPLGTYHIYEVSPPELYQLSGYMQFAQNKSQKTNVMTGLKAVMKLDKNGNVGIFDGDSATENNIKVTNLAINVYDKVYRGSITINKKDQDEDTPLEGVSFRLVGEDGSEYTGTTDSKGTIVWDELIPQNYVITEVSTVDGYNLLKEDIEVTLPIEMTFEEIRKNGADISQAVYDEASGKYCFYNITLTVGNTVTFDIPFTGGEQHTLYVILAAGIATVAFGMAMMLRKRKTG